MPGVNYNPDVLSCLANLSNDEVFTPPEIANAMLDMLPQELFSDPNAKFLDPACKTGVFLREIAKRLIKGLEDKIPNLQERLDHIFHEQLYAIAITELTALVSRRSTYCSKKADGLYSISTFDTPDGNIRYQRTEHKWDGSGKKEDQKCTICGASRSQFDRGKELETHAYEFIHAEDIYKMKFDLIISNPPYQLDTLGAGKQAKPLYNLFVEKSKALKPRYVSMIIPSRWFAGGMGLDSFRNAMMNDNHITRIVDFTNAKDCFPSNSVSGGVCYFLWERDNKSDCKFTNITNGKSSTVVRPLNEFSTLVRYNQAISIIHKVQFLKENKIESITSSLMPFGLSTSVRGHNNKEENDLTLHASDGTSYITRKEIINGHDNIDTYKILISKTSAEHAGEPGKDGRFRVIPSSMKVLKPGEVCTHSYFIVGKWNNYQEAENALSYLSTKIVRFLMLLCVSGFGLSKLVLQFVPMQDFSKPWTDEELYKKYNLTEEEINFIESMIKPMDGGSDA